ncbi:MAG TPA: hypothetical protein VGH07_09225 [Chthoniobacterales bacterium]
MFNRFGVGADRKFKRRAGVPVPDFDGVDPVPMRNLACRQQKVYCRRNGSVLVKGLVPKRFAVVAPFRVWLQVQEPDHVGGCHRAELRHLNSCHFAAVAAIGAAL